MIEARNNSRQARVSKNRIIVLLMVVCAVSAAVAIAVHHYEAKRPLAFVQHWKERFSTINNLETAMRLMGPEPVFVRTFASGEWFIATCEHSCCSGAGFDATVIRDNTGAIYADTTHTFCGMEGISAELGEVPAESLSTFYSHATQLKLQKQ